MSRVVTLRSHTLQIREAKTGCRLHSLVLQGVVYKGQRKSNEGHGPVLQLCPAHQQLLKMWYLDEDQTHVRACACTHAHTYMHTHAHTYRKNQTLPPNVTTVCSPTQDLLHVNPSPNCFYKTSFSSSPSSEFCLHSLSFPVSSLILS